MSESQSTIVKIVEDLLLNHECVVLPGLGGFIVRESPCNFTADKSMIKPAFRNLFFNPHLTQNDGLLCNAIQNCRGISYSDAFATCQTFVKEFQDQIQTEQAYKFGKLGVFYNGQNNIWFSPANEINLSLESYGLESITIQTISQTEETLSISNKSLIDNAPIASLDRPKAKLKPWLVAASIALIFHIGYLFLDNAQIAPTSYQQHQAAIVPSIELPNAIVAESIDTVISNQTSEAIPEIEAVIETPIESEVEVIAPIVTEIKSNPSSATEVQLEVQVLAKYKIQGNAEFHLKDLQKKGINAELIFKDGFYQITTK